MTSDHSESAGQGVKRRRVALACDSCRTRKSRCDGNRPRCTVCTNLGFECSYTTPSEAANVLVGKDYLQRLEARISALEEGLADQRAALTSCVQNLNPLSPESDNNAVLPLPGTKSMSTGPGLDHVDNSVDAMGSVVFADEEDSGFFGPSSNIAFLRHFGANFTTKNSPETQFSPFQGGFINIPRPPSPISQCAAYQLNKSPVDLFALPPAQEITELVRAFFLDTGLLFPYIHPPTFLKPYQHVLEGNTQKLRRTWLGLLNMIFAMVKATARQGITPTSVRMSEANVFYQRALGLCGSEIMRGTTIEVVQLLLLMGQYLQGTQNPVQAWSSHGLAVKAALQLGLHSRDASQAFSPLEQEIRKRTWYGCVVLDRTLSMTLGRPATIPDSYVKLDLPQIQPEDIVEPIAHIEELNISAPFFNATILLYKNLFHVIDQLYGQNLGCQPRLSVAECVSRILSLGQNLELWERSLPDALKIVTANEIRDAQRLAVGVPRTLRFQVILTLRYYHVQTMLHRPILAEFMKTSDPSTENLGEKRLLQQIGFNSIQVCSEAAMNIIGIIHEALNTRSGDQNLLGAWWFTLYYAFHSALILFATLRIHQQSSAGGQSIPFTVEKLIPYQGKAIEAIRKLDTENRIVDRCRYYLERFSEAINPSDLGQGQNGFSEADVDASRSAFDFTSPLGLEFGEFMLDGDFWAVVNQQVSGQTGINLSSSINPPD